MRITREQSFMMMARAAAMRSTCFRLNVGAVLTVNNKIKATGYNGAPKGRPHCLGNDCPGRLICRETIHAEVNAIEQWENSSDMDCLHPYLYVTHSPCRHCTDLIIAHYIEKVFFEIVYRETDHLVSLRQHGRGLYILTPAGFVVDYFTGAVVD